MLTKHSDFEETGRLKKHVAAIHIENTLSLLERKMANVLLLNAYPNLLEQETHRIRISELGSILGFDSHDHDCLKRALVNLMSVVLSWNIVDNRGQEKAWRARPMLTAADLEQGWCLYSYHADLRVKLFNPEVYASINVSIQRRFTSGYALALYENCLRYRRVGTTGWLDLDLVRKLIGATDSYYDEFRRLNAKILKPAIKQINETSDILVDMTFRREKRRVVAARFNVQDNPQLTLFQPALNGDDQLVEERGKNLVDRLKGLGLDEEAIRQLLAEYDTDRVVATVEAVEAQGDGDKAGAMLLRTLNGEAATPSPSMDTVLARLPHERQLQLRTEFEALILASDDPRYAGLRAFYLQRGLAHAAVAGCFRSFARERLQAQEDENAEGKTAG